MKPRTTLVLITAAGLAGPARAQELVRVSYAWLETTLPSGGPPVTNPNSVVDFGECARISVSLNALVNGTSAIGQTTTYAPPPPPGTGTIRGIGSVLFNLRGIEGDTTGQWGAHFVSTILATNASAGTPADNGSAIVGIAGSQELAPGQTANSFNPLPNVFRGIWKPFDYTPRTVRFRVDTAGLGTGAGVSLAVQYGSALLDPNDPASEYALYTLKNVAIDPGTGIDIPIVPAPAAGVPLALGLLFTPAVQETAMTTRTALTLAAAAGLAASARAQERISVTYSWSEVVSGTTTPVPAPNSVLEPGEGAYIRLNIFANVNGVNAIGQTTTYTPPPPPGVGTIRSIASIIYQLTGDNNASTAYGSWNSRSISPILSAGSFLGNITNNGATVDAFGGGQFVAPGQTANGINPIQDAFKGVWTPAGYQQRTVHFLATGQPAGAAGQYNGVILQYGSAFVDPADPSTEYALYFTKFVTGNFGTGISIPIYPIPAPPTSTLLAAAALWTRRRRRSR